MADASDVEQALVDFIANAIYPSGVTSGIGYYLGFFTGPGSASATGDQVRVYRGWPRSASLESDLRAGIVNISVYSQPGVERNTTRYFKDWQTLPVQATAPQLTLTVSGSTVTVGGAIQVGDLAAVKVGKSKAYGAAVVAGSTFASVAAALAVLMAVDFPGVIATGPVIAFGSSAVPWSYYLGFFSGGSITITPPPLGVAVGGNVTSIMELRQQLRGWQVTIWSPTPSQRDAIGKAVDSAFAAIERIALPDQQRARLIYESSRSSDANQLQQDYRRDLFYSVEYSTTVTEIDQTITAFVTSLVDSNGFTFATSVN